jgi:hypothetical protein
MEEFFCERMQLMELSLEFFGPGRFSQQVIGKTYVFSKIPRERLATPQLLQRIALLQQGFFQCSSPDPPRRVFWGYIIRYRSYSSVGQSFETVMYSGTQIGISCDLWRLKHGGNFYEEL